MDTLGKGAGQLIHGDFDTFSQCHGIGTRRLVEGDDGAFTAVQAGKSVVGFHPHFHPGDVLDLDLGAVFLCAHDDLAELLHGLQAVGQSYGVGKLRTRRGRLGAELTAGNDDVLGPDGIDDFGHGNTEVRQSVGLDPDAHGIVAGPQDSHLPDTSNAGQDVLDVDQGVISQKILIVAVPFGSQGDQHQDIGKRLFGGDAEAFDLLRQLGRGGRYPVLGKYRVHVRIGAHLEGGLDHHGAVVGIGGLHVNHVVHPVDFLFQRGGHGLLDTDGIGARIVGAHFDDGRRDVGILLDRQIEQGERSHDNGNDRNNNGHNGPSNKKIPHAGSFLFRRVGGNIFHHWFDHGPVADHLQAFVNHLLPGLDAFCDQVGTTHGRPQGDLALLDRVVFAHHVYAILPLQFGNAALG